MSDLSPEDTAFLAKIGQVSTPAKAEKPAAKKDEE
jgi:hypothetical protein